MAIQKKNILYVVTIVKFTGWGECCKKYLNFLTSKYEKNKLAVDQI